MVVIPIMIIHFTNSIQAAQHERVLRAYERYFSERNMQHAPKIAKRRIIELLRRVLASSKMEVDGMHNIFFELLEIYDFFEYIEGEVVR